jgi:glutathione peroxidase-family protein
MPGLHALQNKLSKKGFTILGVTQFFANGSLPATEGDMKAKLSKTTPVKDMTDKTFLEHLKTFHERVQPSYPFVVASKDEVGAYKVPGYPTLYIVDKQGRIVYVQVGGGRDKILEAVIEKQLAAK